MKKILILAFAVMALVGCKSDGKRVAGSYSYKISGIVEVDSVRTSLDDEMGAMKILSREDGDLILTMNQLNGGVMTTTATWDDESRTITLVPFERILNMGIRGDFLVDVAGKGTYLDETIVFSLQYQGHSMSDSLVLLDGKDLLMVAWK